VNLDQMIKGGYWGTSPFSDRLMIITPAHPDNWYSGGGQFPLRECSPIAFVWHEPQEDSDDNEQTPRYFAQYHPLTPGSTTYYSDSDGDQYQCVPLARAPVANGLKGRPMPRFNDGGPEFGAFSLNQQSHSSEVEGRSHTIHLTMTNAQYDGCVDLAALSMIMYDWPRNPKRVGLAHGDLATDRSDGLWIAHKSGIPQEATNRVIKLEKDINDIKALVWGQAVKQNDTGAILVNHALRLNGYEVHTEHPPGK